MVVGPLGSAIFNEMTHLEQRVTFMRMIQALGELWHKEIRKEDIPALQLRVLEAICLTELHFPAAEADVKLHGLLHLAFNNLTLWGKNIGI